MTKNIRLGKHIKARLRSFIFIIIYVFDLSQLKSRRAQL